MYIRIHASGLCTFFQGFRSARAPATVSPALTVARRRHIILYTRCAVTLGNAVVNVASRSAILRRHTSTLKKKKNNNNNNNIKKYTDITNAMSTYCDDSIMGFIAPKNCIKPRYHICIMIVL
uniref:Uncharacterized protein n=1 Tax=Schizaphis graminum TaxID=13262 RepID=A0A2S2P5K9_SCHGA